MIKTLIFIMKYKILKDPINLSYQTKSFFKLSKNNQRKVLDKYFNKYNSSIPIMNFTSRESSYYEEGQEKNFFNCYYFDKKIIEANIYNIKLIDRFNLDKEKIDYLIEYTLTLIHDIDFDIKQIIKYDDTLPCVLSENISFMTYLVDKNCYNIKYLSYNPLFISKQRELIKKALDLSKKREFDICLFFVNGKLPQILVSNIDFLNYIIKNDIKNICYLSDNLFDNLTISNKRLVIDTIISYLNNSQENLEYLERNSTLFNDLNKDLDFIIFILSLSINNVIYIDWYNMTNDDCTLLINKITDKLRDENIKFNIMKYPFKNLFFQNYQFMSYLVEIDLRWIVMSLLNSKSDMDRLVDLFLEKATNYKFRIKDFLYDGKYLNYRLIENKKMFHYLFLKNFPIVWYIDFFHLSSSRTITENLVDELEKTDIEYEFCNEWYLIDNKYPIPFSNNYRFMRYVIDKNFNNLAYIDTSMIDKRELKRIINYAFRMVYFIRGSNKSLGFDIEGYFLNSMIINDDYFKECLESLDKYKKNT